MRAPNLDQDGWCLEDGEQLHQEAPATFHIPDLKVRNILEPGDFAKLVFRIVVADDAEPEAVERMWVIVRERLPGGYIGMLDNEPTAIEYNTEFWRGSEMPFEPRHIIAVEQANAESTLLARQPAPIPWDKI